MYRLKNKQEYIIKSYFSLFPVLKLQPSCLSFWLSYAIDFLLWSVTVAPQYTEKGNWSQEEKKNDLPKKMVFRKWYIYSKFATIDSSWTYEPVAHYFFLFLLLTLLHIILNKHSYWW